MKPVVTKDLYDTWMRWTSGKIDFGSVYCDYRPRNEGGMCRGCVYNTPTAINSCCLYRDGADHNKENRVEYKRIISGYLPNKLELI